MKKWQEFRYWLGSPQGALVYFGMGYGLVALWWFYGAK